MTENNSRRSKPLPAADEASPAPRIGFAGTPEFAAVALRYLLTAGYRPEIVLTQPDRPAGRGRKLRASAVKELARSEGLTVAQPESLRKAALVSELGLDQLDCLIVAAYGLLLPQAVLDAPRIGCINVHASLLPRWRGAAPIVWAIASGDEATGVCLMQMEAGLDTGPVFASQRTPIRRDETSVDLHNRLAQLGGNLLVQKLPELLAGRMTGTAILGDISFALGDSRQAQVHYEQALTWSKSGPLNSSRVGQVTMHLYASVSNLWRELGDLETALNYVSEGLAAAEHAILPVSEYQMYKVLARIKEAKGEFQEALDSFETAEALRGPTPFPDSRPIPAMRARLWARQGRLTEALGWADRLPNPDEMEPIYQNEFELMTYVRVKLLELEQAKEGAVLEKAEALLERLFQLADEAGRLGSVIELLILQAFARQASGKLAEAVQLIERALAVAEPAGYVRIFADEGKQIRPLLAAALAKSSAPAYITRLIGAIDLQLGGEEKGAADPNKMLIEPLSKRELQVLGLLSGGHSNQSIADELVIALSTVKKHVNNILGKLNVDSRIQAVNRARELNII
ncbi:MAG: formyltransferase family protein [Chloroflexota bacterium]